MIIWRGWGVIAFAFFLLTGMLGIGLPYSIDADNSWAISRWLLPVLAVAAAAGNWFCGWWLNRRRPQQQLDAALPRLREQVYRTVSDGTFALGPPHPRPSSQAEAQAQAEYYLGTVQARYQAAFNQHTLFFVPFQWWSIGILAFGLILPFALR